jgi:hypothetical protein
MQFLERVPSGYIKDKQGLIEGIKKAKGQQAAQPTAQPTADPMAQPTEDVDIQALLEGV